LFIVICEKGKEERKKTQNNNQQLPLPSCDEGKLLRDVSDWGEVRQVPSRGGKGD